MHPLKLFNREPLTLNCPTQAKACSAMLYLCTPVVISMRRFGHQLFEGIFGHRSIYRMKVRIQTQGLLEMLAD
jgi:hypothetical protein